MISRLDVQRLIPHTDVTLRSPPNWTAVLFFGGLSSLHLYLATSAFLNHRIEGYMSLIFGTFFACVSIACWRICRDLTLVTEGRKLRLRTGFRRWYSERCVPFSEVRSIRLTLLHPKHPMAARIEVVCDREVIECPPTVVPRQEALCLAVTMGVKLVKVYGDSFGPVADRLDRLSAE